MASYKVGPHGQIIISREIRERLGIKPGDQLVQYVVGDHIELRLVRKLGNGAETVVVSAPTPTATTIVVHERPSAQDKSGFN